MTAHPGQTSDELPCHRCGYDLRAHPPDGICPECKASVAEARRWAAIPRRPAWRDSDPRWRRRMLAGMWLLVLLPLVDVVQAFGWDKRVTVPAVFEVAGNVRTLDETFLLNMGIYPRLIFCIGVALLFSTERGRQRARLDWTRRWGIGCSYITLLLNGAPILYITALVLTGISAVFLAMPPEYQPGVTRWFVLLSTAYLRYGPDPNDVAWIVLLASSSIAILLACVPLFDALRSSGSQRLATILLAPLAMFALLHLAQAVLHFVGLTGVPPSEIARHSIYFSPETLARYVAGQPVNISGWVLGAFIMEAIKWCAVLAIAVWLTVARLASWSQSRVKGT